MTSAQTLLIPFCIWPLNLARITIWQNYSFPFSGTPFYSMNTVSSFLPPFCIYYSLFLKEPSGKMYPRFSPLSFSSYAPYAWSLLTIVFYIESLPWLPLFVPSPGLFFLRHIKWCTIYFIICVLSSVSPTKL